MAAKHLRRTAASPMSHNRFASAALHTPALILQCSMKGNTGSNKRHPSAGALKIRRMSFGRPALPERSRNVTGTRLLKGLRMDGIESVLNQSLTVLEAAFRIAIGIAILAAPGHLARRLGYKGWYIYPAGALFFPIAVIYLATADWPLAEQMRMLQRKLKRLEPDSGEAKHDEPDLQAHERAPRP